MTRRYASLFLVAWLAPATPALAQPGSPAEDNKDATLSSLRAEIRRLQTQQMHQGQQVRKDIVEHLIDSLKAAGKKFEYKIYDNAPGGHYFNRIDTPLARESRRDIMTFLARYLKQGPETPSRE